MSDGWFVQYKVGDRVTTQWEFSIDGLTEDQATEIDRRIKAVVDEVQGAQDDGSQHQPGCRAEDGFPCHCIALNDGQES